MRLTSAFAICFASQKHHFLAAIGARAIDAQVSGEFGPVKRQRLADAVAEFNEELQAGPGRPRNRRFWGGGCDSDGFGEIAEPDEDEEERRDRLAHEKCVQQRVARDRKAVKTLKERLGTPAGVQSRYDVLREALAACEQTQYVQPEKEGVEIPEEFRVIDIPKMQKTVFPHQLNHVHESLAIDLFKKAITLREGEGDDTEGLIDQYVSQFHSIFKGTVGQWEDRDDDVDNFVRLNVSYLAELAISPMTGSIDHAHGACAKWIKAQDRAIRAFRDVHAGSMREAERCLNGQCTCASWKDAHMRGDNAVAAVITEPSAAYNVPAILARVLRLGEDGFFYRKELDNAVFEDRFEKIVPVSQPLRLHRELGFARQGDDLFGGHEARIHFEKVVVGCADSDSLDFSCQVDSDSD